jgi:hypothetical protein
MTHTHTHTHTHIQTGLVEWLKMEGPEFKPQYHKKKKRKRLD